jgi:hypothetical protein
MKKKKSAAKRYVTLEERDGASRLTFSGTGPRVFTAFIDSFIRKLKPQQDD